jgi:hypothetical protein
VLAAPTVQGALQAIARFTQLVSPTATLDLLPTARAASSR